MNPNTHPPKDGVYMARLITHCHWHGTHSATITSVGDDYAWVIGQYMAEQGRQDGLAATLQLSLDHRMIEVLLYEPDEPPPTDGAAPWQMN